MKPITKKILLHVADAVEIIGIALSNTATFIRDIAGIAPESDTTQEKEPDSIELSLRGNARVMFRRSQLQTNLNTRLHAHACISLGMLAAATCKSENELITLYNELENKAFPLALPAPDKSPNGSA